MQPCLLVAVRVSDCAPGRALHFVPHFVLRRALHLVRAVAPAPHPGPAAGCFPELFPAAFVHGGLHCAVAGPFVPWLLGHLSGAASGLSVDGHRRHCAAGMSVARPGLPAGRAAPADHGAGFPAAVVLDPGDPGGPLAGSGAVERALPARGAPSHVQVRFAEP